MKLVYVAALIFALSAGVALAQFDEAPSSPLPLSQAGDAAHFDVQVHTRNPAYWTALESMQAGHGVDCSAPPASHENHTYEGSVFICNGHLMTALNASDYGEIVVTPSQVLDLSGGTGVVQWEMSTQRDSTRDWPDIWVTPWGDNLTLPFDTASAGEVDLQGPPLTGVHVGFGSSEFAPLVSTISNGSLTTYNHGWDTAAANSGIVAGTNQAAVRQTFRLTLTPGHLKFERLASATATAIVFFDGNVNAFPMTEAMVVQFAQHSYNPTKDGAGVPATWHWDNFTLTPSEPFTMIKATQRSTSGGVVAFNAPAPADAYLRFSAICRVSVNGVVQPRQRFTNHPEHASSYFVPIAAGVQQVTIGFSADSWYSGPCMARDFSIWALASVIPQAPTSTPSTSPSATASPSPSPSSTPSPQPSATATSSPSPTSTPTAIVPTATASPTRTPTLVPCRIQTGANNAWTSGTLQPYGTGRVCVVN